jgi:hypothetical protein
MSQNSTGTLPTVGPFQTFRDYVAGVERKTIRRARRATVRHKAVAKGPGIPGHRRVTLVECHPSMN